MTHYWDDDGPVGRDRHCQYCKAEYGIHDGLCADCDARFREGPPPPLLSDGLLTEDDIIEMERRDAASFFADETRREWRECT